MNVCTLTGNLTKDIELNYTPKGTACAKFTIAVRRKFKNQNGEYDTDFLPCVAWDKQAEFLANYAGKGDKIELRGSIETRNYEKNGNTVYVTEIRAEEVGILNSVKRDEHPIEKIATRASDDEPLPF